MDSTTLFGAFLILINLISAFAIFSQIRLTYHRKNTIGLARFPWFMGTTNAAAGLIYSLLINDLPFIIANLAWCSMNGIMFALILYYGRAAKSTTGVNNP